MLYGLGLSVWAVGLRAGVVLGDYEVQGLRYKLRGEVLAVGPWGFEVLGRVGNYLTFSSRSNGAMRVLQGSLGRDIVSCWRVEGLA